MMVGGSEVELSLAPCSLLVVVLILSRSIQAY